MLRQEVPLTKREKCHSCSATDTENQFLDRSSQMMVPKWELSMTPVNLSEPKFWTSLQSYRGKKHTFSMGESSPSMQHPAKAESVQAQGNGF